jgi:hypothetical protein
MIKSEKFILIVSISILLIISGFCGYKVHTLSVQEKQVKTDYSIVNNISFGLLSVSQWRDQVVSIVSDQIEKFEFTNSQEADLQKEIEQILNSLISKAIGIINKPQRSFGGKLKKFVFKTFVDTTDLREQVPVFAKQIIEQIKKPANKEKIKNIAQDKLQELGQQTYDSSAHEIQSVTDSIFNKYHVQDSGSFEKATTDLLTILRRQTYNYAFSMIASTIVILILWWVLREKPELHRTLYIFSVLSALILLLVGLTTTMIELDARIKFIDFRLIGATISFKNQVLFFQSKSIIDVVRVLIDTGKWDMIIVGILILCFSVFFPFAKLISACIHLLGNKKYATNKFISFFAFKSGKWSMADVMVVAIMMTYIGFNGVVESQLSDLNIHNDTITSITTNNTSLQPGYIVFVGFVVYGLILSQILKKITNKRSAAHL